MLDADRRQILNRALRQRLGMPSTAGEGAKDAAPNKQPEPEQGQGGRKAAAAIAIIAALSAGPANAQAVYTTTTSPTWNGTRTVTTSSSGATYTSETTKDYAGNVQTKSTYTPAPPRSQGYTGMGSGYRPMGR